MAQRWVFQDPAVLILVNDTFETNNRTSVVTMLPTALRTSRLRMQP